MCSIKKVVSRNFAKFTGKHLCQSTCLIKLQPLGLLIILINSVAHAVLYWQELIPFLSQKIYNNFAFRDVAHPVR